MILIVLEFKLRFVKNIDLDINLDLGFQLSCVNHEKVSINDSLRISIDTPFKISIDRTIAASIDASSRKLYGQV